MLVETWRNGIGGKLGPTCPLRGVTVTNMANVVIKFDNGQQVVFNTTEDHAKWAVSNDVKKPWFCNGSLNRMVNWYYQADRKVYAYVESPMAIAYYIGLLTEFIHFILI